MRPPPGRLEGVRGWLLWNGPVRMLLWRSRALARDRTVLKHRVRARPGVLLKRERVPVIALHGSSLDVVVIAATFAVLIGYLIWLILSQ